MLSQQSSQLRIELTIVSDFVVTNQYLSIMFNPYLLPRFPLWPSILLHIKNLGSNAFPVAPFDYIILAYTTP